MSVLPLFTVMLPGMCIVVMAQVQPKAVQVVLLSLTFAVPVLGDTLAFFVGSRVRGPKLCPAVSPNKTISGAIAGLGGSAELLGTQFRLINGFGAGYGFDGVAMALIGQLHPIATMVVALFFAVLRVGSTTMQAATGVPTSVSDIIQALVIVFSVAGMALTKLPEFEAWKSRVFGKRKEGAA